MEDGDIPATVQQLISVAGTPTRRKRPGSVAAAPPPASGGLPLHSSLAQELSAVDSMFRRWQSEAVERQRAAAAARDFQNDSSFSLALLVLNKRGEVRRGARAAQGWYFVPRQASQHAGELPCTRCCLHIARRQTYFVDRAARVWHQADEVCRGCMLCLMRSLLGQDDAAILEEARGILDSSWAPNINAALAEALDARRLLLAEL